MVTVSSLYPCLIAEDIAFVPVIASSNCDLIVGQNLGGLGICSVSRKHEWDGWGLGPAMDFDDPRAGKPSVTYQTTLLVWRSKYMNPTVHLGCHISDTKCKVRIKVHSDIVKYTISTLHLVNHIT